MAINKKGSRLIIVDNEKYRWSIRKKPTYCQAAFGEKMTCAVESVGNRGCVLLITFPWRRNDYWLSAQEVTSVTPKLVETCIREALKQGWQPSVKGIAFKFDKTP